MIISITMCYNPCFTVTHMVNAPFMSSLGGCTSLMLVQLVGVELTPQGRVWLQKNLAPSQTVWLKLISREDDMLHCLVSQSRVSKYDTGSGFSLSASG